MEVETNGNESIIEDIGTLECRELLGRTGCSDDLVASDISQQLAIYLLEEDLCNAKFLWKRTSKALKDNPELNAIWNVGQALWTRNMNEFYIRSKAFEWTPKIRPIMNRLVSSIQQKMIRLIGMSYTSILNEEVANLVGISLAEVPNLCQQQNWNIVGNIVEPIDPPSEDAPLASTDCQIENLTNFVSVLEN